MNVERVLADILRHPDPAAALREALADQGLSSDLRHMLEAIDPDGLRLSAMLAARLRFERLVQGSRKSATWFRDDAAGFAEAFRRYHADVPPRATFPAGEASQFEAWLRRVSVDAPGPCEN